MRIKRICFPVRVLGPGNRVGIWVTGCNFRCKNCMSPELQDYNSGNDIEINRIMAELNKFSSRIDGFTISGGEPFEQPNELEKLVNRINDLYGNDIIIYTGYTLDELQEKKNKSIENILKKISVLIDGRYVEEKNNGIGLRGSSNQKIYLFDNFERYKDLEKEQRKLQKFSYLDEQDIIVGLL